MTSQVRKQTLTEWRNRLRRVELSIPGDVLEKVAVEADKRNVGCAEFILEAVETALRAASHDLDDRRPNRSAEKRDASCDPALAALIEKERGNGLPWDSVAARLNEVSQSGKKWTEASLRAYAWCNDIAQWDEPRKNTMRLAT